MLAYLCRHDIYSMRFHVCLTATLFGFPCATSAARTGLSARQSGRRHKVTGSVERPGGSERRAPTEEVEVFAQVGDELFGDLVGYVQGAAVVDDVVGAGGLFVLGHLGLHAAAGLLGVEAGGLQAAEADVVGGGDDDHAVVASGAAGLVEQGGLGDDDGGVGLRGDLLDAAGLAVADRRVQDRFEAAARGGVGEDDAAEGGTVDLAVGAEDGLAGGAADLTVGAEDEPADGAAGVGERGDDRVVRGLAGGQALVGEAIGVEHMAAELGHPSGHRRLAGGDVAGEAGAQDGCSSPHFSSPFVARSRRAVRNVG